jgi:phage baseplate assembly protein W
MATQTDTPPPIGWPLLPLPDEHGQLNWPTLEDSIRQSLRVILSTRPGEQLKRPDFGAGLAGFLGTSNTVATRRRLHDVVEKAVTRWEPRILVDRIEIIEIPTAPTQLRIEIAYRVQRTGTAQQLGVTLELGA